MIKSEARAKARANMPKGYTGAALNIGMTRWGLNTALVSGMSGLTERNLHNLLCSSNTCQRPLLKLEEILGVAIISEWDALYARVGKLAKTKLQKQIAEFKKLAVQHGKTFADFARWGITPKLMADILMAKPGVEERHYQALELELRHPIFTAPHIFHEALRQAEAEMDAKADAEWEQGASERAEEEAPWERVREVLKGGFPERLVPIQIAVMRGPIPPEVVAAGAKITVEKLNAIVAGKVDPKKYYKALEAALGCWLWRTLADYQRLLNRWGTQ